MRFIGKTCLLALIAMAVTFTSIQAGEFEVDSRQEGTLLKRKIRASQFLHHATFGPTMDEIDALALRMMQVGVRRACNEWIDDQFSKPATYHQPVTEQMIADDGFTTGQNQVWIQRYRYHSWWDTALNADDQLRQRMAWALAQIVVTSEDGAGFNDRNLGDLSGKGRWLGPTNYYDMLVRNSFGNYRDLLTDVTYHPIMGVYLSHMRNRKSNGVRFPDENYAREVMQLFTIGLYELHNDGRLKTTANGELIPTYDNELIKTLGRVFTGLAFKPDNPSNPFYSGNDFLFPMEMYNPEHDTDPKLLINGETIDLNDGDAEIEATLDSLFEHDNTAPFIAYRLIQRFVKSNPSRGYIRRVARTFANNGRGVRGDMKSVIKRILLDPEAFQSMRVRSIRQPEGEKVVVTARGTEYSRLREPVIRYTSLLRGSNAQSDYPTGRAMITPRDYDWTQEPYKQPTVFSFFLPSYQPPGDLTVYSPSRRISTDLLVSPEFQQKTAVTSNRLMNRYIWDISSMRAQFTARNAGFYDLECNMIFDLSEEMALASEEDTMIDVIDRFDLLHCCGTMPQDYKEKMANQINDDTRWMPGNSEFSGRYEEYRVGAALMSTVLSPFAAVGE